MIWVWTTIYAIQAIFYAANYWSLGFIYSWKVIVLGVVLLAPLFAFLWLNLVSRLFHWVGRYLGGQAGQTELRTVIARSKLPHLLFLPFWALSIGLNPSGAFILGEGIPSPLLILAVSLGIGCWCQTLCVRSLCVTQGFSVRRSIACLMTSWLLYALLFFTLFALIRFALHP